MSFILDALRKSEQERQQASVPIVSSMPVALDRSSLPRWAVAVMTTLSAALLAVALLWWHGSPMKPFDRSRATADQLSEATVARRTAIPNAASEVSETAPRPAAIAAVEPPRVAAPVAIEPTVPTSLADLALTPARTTAVAAAPPAAVSPSTTTLPPTRAELLARGIEVPSLDLQLHVYAPTAAQRFVFVNGAKLTEGDRLPEGPTVVEITSDGVVLRQNGADFFLPRS